MGDWQGEPAGDEARYNRARPRRLAGAVRQRGRGRGRPAKGRRHQSEQERREGHRLTELAIWSISSPACTIFELSS